MKTEHLGIYLWRLATEYDRKLLWAFAARLDPLGGHKVMVRPILRGDSVQLSFFYTLRSEVTWVRK